MTSYRGCVDQLNNTAVSTVVITGMIYLDAGWRTYPVSNVSGKAIVGQGHHTGFTYTGGVQTGKAIAIWNSAYVTVDNLAIYGAFANEGWLECPAQGTCETPLTVEGAVDPDSDVPTSHHVTVGNVKIANSRGDAALVLGTHHLSWISNTIDNAASMGLHAGFDQRQNWNRYLTVDNSRFTNVRANALWLQVYGAGDYQENVVRNSWFYGNHRYGIYSCGDRPCAGGQIALSSNTSSLTLSRIVVADGSCPSCTGANSHGIELNSLWRVKIVDSEIRNNRGTTIYANWGPEDNRNLLADLEIANNCFRYNNRDAVDIPETIVKRWEYREYGNSYGTCDKGLG
ncbi:hypothetical protein [Micromonospora maritima]|uniref:hypothetical protein n=1 Tax=Micromonospora maritima TaxID=986711 RepID=UPI0037A7DC1A